ncbi:MAG: hypothetical protein FWH38_03835 [Treponema sp.]|nr:hypothetical protein [Treponema sp.]
MKKNLFIFLIVLAVVLAASCASTGKTTTTTVTTTTTTTTTEPATPERKVNSGIPQFVKDAIKKTPEDALIGIGTARAASLSLARTTSATRARAEISRQMNTMIQDMVRDYSAGSEVDPQAALSFQENITVALSKSTLTGASIAEEDIDDNNNYWTVVVLSKASAVQEITQAQSAAKLAVPAMASFNAEDRMNAAFDKVFAEEVGYSDN